MWKTEIISECKYEVIQDQLMIVDKDKSCYVIVFDLHLPDGFKVEAL